MSEYGYPRRNGIGTPLLAILLLLGGLFLWGAGLSDAGGGLPVCWDEALGTYTSSACNAQP